MFFQSQRRTILHFALCSVASSLLFVSQGEAQGTQQTDPGVLAQNMQQYAKGSEKVTRENRDGVYLEITYWRAKKPGKTTPVVLLLPMKGRTQRELYPLAHALYEDEFAVLTFDFRGQGESTHINPSNYKSPADLKKEEEIREMMRKTGKRVVIPGTGKLVKEDSKTRGDTISYQDDFRNDSEFGDMMVRDLEDVKRYMIELHNAGQFNVQQMGLVGFELSASVALTWMAKFEFQEEGKTGWVRQGGDVAALVLVTPSANYGGFRADTNLGKAANDLPIFLIGNEGKEKRDALALARKLRLPDLKEANQRSSSFLRPDSAWTTVNSTLFGTQLLNPPVEALDATIRGYLGGRLKDVRGRIWKERNLDVDLGFGSGR